MIAAERDTSLSALVKDYLVALGSGESAGERLLREERALREQIKSFPDPTSLPYLQRALAIATFEPGMYEVVQTFEPAAAETG